MNKLISSIKKDVLLLLKDRAGLLLMFLMPIVLVLVITSLQNNTFNIINSHQISLVIFNSDGGQASDQFIEALEKVGMFTISVDTKTSIKELQAARMEEEGALASVVLKAGFSENIDKNAQEITAQALSEMGVSPNNSTNGISEINPLDVFYSPVLHESYRQAIESAVQSSLKIVQSRKMLNLIYMSISDQPMSKDVEAMLLSNQITINASTLTKDGTGKIPDATQHNVPAWTIFAMFFMVVSLGGSLVREKLNGSFIRLKTIHGAYLYHLISKQTVYLFAALIQVAVIFSLGVFLFPTLGLPKLILPNLGLLLLVAIASAFAAVSYALCLGVFSNTQEQSNGFGAVSVVIFAALGGILVPMFAMPETFRSIAGISPLYWCLQAFYELFLNEGVFLDLLPKVIPIFVFGIVLQFAAFVGLKRKNLI